MSMLAIEIYLTSTQDRELIELLPKFGAPFMLHCVICGLLDIE